MTNAKKLNAAVLAGAWFLGMDGIAFLMLSPPLQAAGFAAELFLLVTCLLDGLAALTAMPGIFFWGNEQMLRMTVAEGFDRTQGKLQRFGGLRQGEAMATEIANLPDLQLCERISFPAFCLRGSRHEMTS